MMPLLKKCLLITISILLAQGSIVLALPEESVDLQLTDSGQIAPVLQSAEAGKAITIAFAPSDPLATTESRKLKASDPGSDDLFSEAVAVDGDTLVVGAPQEDDAGSNAGSVYIFHRNQGGPDHWGQVGKITGSDTDTDDLFGTAVAISGDTIVVGAPGSSGVGNPSGAVYVFRRNQGTAHTWGQVTKISPADNDTGDLFGSAVAIDDEVIVAGAPGDSDLFTNCGSAYVFTRNQGGPDAWGEVEKLVSSGASASDRFGDAVAISVDTIVVGAELDDGGATSGGAAYVFTRNLGGPDGWDEVAALQASDASNGKSFGYSVAISNDTVIVGAYRDGSTEPEAGAVYFYERNTGGADSWGQVIKVTAAPRSAGAWFGRSVSIYDDFAVTGASRADASGGTAAGLLYIFRRNIGGADAWGITEVIEASDGDADDFFGGEVTINCGTIVAGATGDDDDTAGSGAVYLVEHAGAAWLSSKRILPGDTTPINDFGRSIAMSGDTLVVGRSCDEVVGPYSGSAFVFVRNQGSADEWQQVAKLIPEDASSFDYFGRSVGVDGDTIVVGAYNAGNARGAAYIFERNYGGHDTWGQVKKLLAFDGGMGGHFGGSVAISGDTIAIGAYDREGVTYNGIGVAYIFERNLGGVDNWGERIIIVNPEPYSDDRFATAISLDNDTLIVGCPNDNSASAYDVGSAFVFERNQDGADAWGQIAKLTHSDASYDDHCGISVAISGNTAVMGCWYDSDIESAYVFQRTHDGADAFVEVAKLDASDTSANQSFKVNVACGTIVIGAPSDRDWGDYAGAIFVFRRDPGGPADTWEKVAKLYSQTPSASAEFGRAVAITCEHIAAASSDESYVDLFDLQRVEADLSISKSNHLTSIAPGATITYYLQVSNSGPDDIIDAVVTDVFNPASFDLSSISWTCSPSASAGPETACPASGNADDLNTGVFVDIGSGDLLELSIQVKILRGPTDPVVNTASVRPPVGAIDPDESNNSASDSDGLLELDLGDAPDPTYPTLHASDGAAHVVGPWLRLGSLVDADTDGHPTAGADGDDLDGADDEDGVVFTSPVYRGQQSTIVVDASDIGILDVWIDSNADGDWDDPGEQLFATTGIANGTNHLYLWVPADAQLGPTYMRFRFSSEYGLGPTGVAWDGEVEDYLVNILEPPLEPLHAFAAVAGDEQNQLFWRNPTGVYHSTMIVARAGVSPTSPTDPLAVVLLDEVQAPGENYSLIHNGLTNGATWHYAGYTRTIGGEISGSKRVSARPQSMTGPVNWIYSTGASALAPPAILPESGYFAVSNDRIFHAMSWDTGGWPTGWSSPIMNGPAQGRPPVLKLPFTTVAGASTAAFIGSQDGKVYAINAMTGTQLWETVVLGSPGAMVQAAPSVMLVDYGAPFDLVVAGTWDTSGSAVHGINLQTGAVVWTFDDSGAGTGVISTQPSIDPSMNPPRVYFASRARTAGSPTVWCLEFGPTSASELWSIDLGDVDGTPTLWNNRVYVGNNNGEVYALDPSTGAELWPAPWPTGDGPVKKLVWPDFDSDRLYFSTTNKVHAITDIGSAAEGFWSYDSWFEKQKILAVDGAAGDNFGAGVAIYADTAFIGGNLADVNGSASGSAYIHYRAAGGPGNWGFVKKIVPADNTSGDYFGRSVGLSGDTAIAGAFGDDDGASSTGSAYIFARDEGGADQWGQVEKLHASDATASAYFGWAVDLSQDTAIVSARRENSYTGSAYIFYRNEGGANQWGEVKKVLASDGATADYFGCSVAIDIDTTVVGANGHDTGAISGAGAAYIYERNAGGPNNWGQVKKLTLSSPASGDSFGTSVAISGDMIIVGAEGTGYYGSSSGSAWVFERDRGGPANWGLAGGLVPAGTVAWDRFGCSVAISGDQFIVGACGRNSSTGALYIFRRNPATGLWQQKARVEASDGATSDQFGRSCAVSGSTVISGAPYDDDYGSGSGSAYVFGPSIPEELSAPSFPIVINGKVYVGAGDGHLYQYDSSVLAPEPFPIQLGDPVIPKTIGSPGFDVKIGQIIVGSDEGRIYTISVPLP
jgi:uncharacterized repeat protein (TIGR01451 family)